MHSSPPRPTESDAAAAAATDIQLAVMTRRLVNFTVILGGAVTLIGLARFLQGAHRAAYVEWGTMAAMMAVRTWALQRPSEQRLRMAGRILVGLGLACIAGAAILLGQSKSPSLYYLVLVPLAGGYYGGPRAAFWWGVGAVLTVAGVVASERLVHLVPELPFSDRDVIGTLVIVIVIVTGFTVTAERTLARRNQQLEEARDQAMEASRLKSSFLANMSHEIRTPLTGVLGLTEMLLATDLDVEQRELATTISSSGQTLLTIINDVLHLARIESGKLQVEHVPFDARRALEDVAQLFGEAARAKNVAIAVEVDPAVPWSALGDPTRFRQILSNLVSNAVKFTSEGVVRVQARMVAHDDGGAPTLRVDVSDDGIGIPADVLPRLFRAFEQADSSTTRRFGGTGLGLAICAQLLGLMNGRIGVEPDRTHGACFWFELPVPPAPDDAAARAEAARAAAPLAGRLVVVLDPNDATRAATVALVRGFGMRVHDVAAREAFGAVILERRAAGVRVDAVVLPDEVRALASELTGPDRPACVVVAPPVTEAASAPGVDAVVTPPVRTEQLRRALLVALEVDRAADAAAPAAALADRRAHPLRGRRVLVVEDNKVNLLIARRFLTALGAEVTEAGNGREAVDVVGPGRFDLVLMDCQMPVMDGYDATRAIRADEAIAGRRRVPIIAMTANAFDEDVARCLEAGMDDHLAKPYTLAQLTERIGAWLGPRRGDARSSAAA